MSTSPIATTEHKLTSSGLRRRHSQSILRLLTCFGACIVAINIVAAAYGYLRYDSVAAAYHMVRGERVLIDESVKELGTFRASDGAETAFRITNLSPVPIEVPGGTISCGCAVLKGLPLRIAPGDSGVVQVCVAPATYVKAESREDFVLDLEIVLFGTHSIRMPQLKVLGTIRYD